MEAVHRQKRALRLILAYSDEINHQNVMHSALQAMTFDVLGLTHTCHRHRHSAFSCFPKIPYPENDIRDIQSVEENDHRFLHELLDEFNDTWDAEGADIMDFVDGYWTTRIEEILIERETPRIDELERLERIGVKLTTYGPSLPEISEETRKIDDHELFERKVKAILDEDHEEYWRLCMSRY